MSIDSPDPELRLARLRWAGPVVVLLSVLAVIAIRLVGVAIVDRIRGFFPLTPALPVFDTIVFASAAVLVFARFCRDNANPIADYRRLALWILLISFIPDVLLAVTHGFGGGCCGEEHRWLIKCKSPLVVPAIPGRLG